MHDVAKQIVRRGMEASEKADFFQDLPELGRAIISIEILLMIPLVIWAAYSLANVFATLAMIEDDEPANRSYEALPNEPASEKTNATIAMLKSDSPAPPPRGPITSNVFKTMAHMRAINGRFSALRGFGCLLITGFALSSITGFLSLVLPSPLQGIASLIASLAVAPAIAAWTHLIMTPRSQKYWFRRMPAFGRTIRATGQAICLNWFALQSILLMSHVARGHIMSCKMTNGESATEEDAERSAAVVLVDMMFGLIYPLIIIPTEVMVARSMATLLPENEESFISFDRTLGGRVQENASVSIVSAWQSISGRAWIRITKLFIQMIALVLAFFVPMLALIALQAVVMRGWVQASGSN